MLNQENHLLPFIEVYIEVLPEKRVLFIHVNGDYLGTVKKYLRLDKVTEYSPLEPPNRYNNPATIKFEVDADKDVVEFAEDLAFLLTGKAKLAAFLLPIDTLPEWINDAIESYRYSPNRERIFGDKSL